MNELQVFVGRQPILDRAGNIFGYELLYRNSETNSFPNVDPEKATIGVLINTFLTIGVDRVTDGGLSFINFTRKLLAQDIFTKLNPDRVVIEILEDVEITPALITRLRTFKQVGFKLALDDFILQEQYLIHQNLFELIDIVKVDVLNTTVDERIQIEEFTKQYPNIILLAEKIETESQFFTALEYGYGLFQGYFFAKPEIVKSAEIPSNVTLHFHILHLLNKETACIDDISQLIMRDVSLSYKLLRFINSLAFDIPKQISSIKQAIVLIGLRDTKKWMQVLILHDLGAGMAEGRVKALVDFSLHRAKLCELLAKRNRKKNADEYFLVGMFSLINAIMKRPWEDILPLLSLSEEVVRTLIGEKTEITPYLQLAEAVERFEWDRLQVLSEELGISEPELSRLSMQAHRWVLEIE